MRTPTIVATLAALAAVPLVALPATAADRSDDRHRGADQAGRAFEAELSPVPHNSMADHGSTVTGEADLMLRGHRLGVDLEARGLTPGMPHLMHIHGLLDAMAHNECPPAAADVHGPGGATTPPDGLIDVGEGLPYYGPIDVSFTTRGDTSPASALDLARFPVADREGEMRYQRTMPIGADVANRLGGLVIVVHGLDLNGDRMYSPYEKALPVACGPINMDD